MKSVTFLIPAENEMLEAASYYESKAKKGHPSLTT